MALRLFFRDLLDGLFEGLDRQLMVFIGVVIGLTALVFLFGGRLGAWILPSSVVVVGGLTWLKKGTWRAPALFLGTLFGCFVVSLFLFPTPATDAAAYHYPAIYALAKGWNPIWAGTEVALSDVLGGLCGKLSHITLQSKGTWYFAAACYRCTNIFDSGNALGVLAMVIAGIAWFKGWRMWVPNGSRVLAVGVTVVAIASPWCLFSVGDPMIDGIVYHLTLALLGYVLVFLCVPTRGNVFALLFVGMLMCSMKFTALIPVALALLVCLLGNLWIEGRVGMRRNWLGPALVTAVLALSLNVSPLVTNAARFGSPLYPVVVFGECEPINLTADFDAQNADRAMMGRFSRWAYAFVSKCAITGYYNAVLGRSDFRPTIQAPEGIEGFGGVFRGVFIAMTLVLLFMVGWQAFKGRLSSPFCLGLILYGVLVLSSLLVPIKYVGYGRYVFAFYLSVFIGCLLVYVGVRNRVVGTLLVVVFAVFIGISSGRLLVPSVGRLVLLSVQNTVVMAHLLNEDRDEAYFLEPKERPALRLWIESVYPGKVRYVETLPAALHVAKIANFTYTCGTRTPVEFPPLRYGAGSGEWVNYDRAEIARRLKAYVAQDFLPWLFRHIACYPKAIIVLRWGQMCGK